jgi:hypothetical protein
MHTSLVQLVFDFAHKMIEVSGHKELDAFEWSQLSNKESVLLVDDLFEE